VSAPVTRAEQAERNLFQMQEAAKDLTRQLGQAERDAAEAAVQFEQMRRERDEARAELAALLERAARIEAAARALIAHDKAADWRDGLRDNCWELQRLEAALAEGEG